MKNWVNVTVMSAGVVIDEMRFKTMQAAEGYASEMQDRGFKVRIV